MTQNFNPTLGLTQVVNPKDTDSSMWADAKAIAAHNLTLWADREPKATKADKPPKEDKAPKEPKEEKEGADPKDIKREPPPAPKQ